jgi:hypothetical protein
MSELGPDLEPWSETETLGSVPWSHGELRVGDAVRLRPRPGADILDLALVGRAAHVESIVRDFEDEVHIAVVVDDDPGADLGALRMPGHRFFFRLSEVEPA